MTHPYHRIFEPVLITRGSDGDMLARSQITSAVTVVRVTDAGDQGRKGVLITSGFHASRSRARERS